MSSVALAREKVGYHCNIPIPIITSLLAVDAKPSELYIYDDNFFDTNMYIKIIQDLPCDIS